MGFWKATGTEKACLIIGARKAVVFYIGKPEGVKTDWIMNEYRLADAESRLPRAVILIDINYLSCFSLKVEIKYTK